MHIFVNRRNTFIPIICLRYKILQLYYTKEYGTTLLVLSRALQQIPFYGCCCLLGRARTEKLSDIGRIRAGFAPRFRAKLWGSAIYGRVHVVKMQPTLGGCLEDGVGILEICEALGGVVVLLPLPCFSGTTLSTLPGECHED